MWDGVSDMKALGEFKKDDVRAIYSNGKYLSH
jgi:hypothetical protein